MAGRNIKGITIEIGGDTTGLEKALSGVNGKIKDTQTQLKDVNNLLKLDPSNIVLVAQKQELLKDAIANTTEKLDSLEAAQKDVTAALEAGKIGQEQYMAFQREVEETRATLTRYETELGSLNTEQDRLSTNTDRLNKLFQATKSDVDDYADVLGNRLVTAIKNGSATADQMKLAIEKIGRSCTDGKADIGKLTSALDTVDDGTAIQNLIQELKEAANQADTTSDQLDEMGQTLTGGVLMEAADQLSVVGDKITELGEKATDAFLQTDDATTKAKTYFAETGDAAEQTAKVIKDVYTDGVGESMNSVSDAVITVKKNLKDLDEITLKNLTEQAITLDELYGIDMNETLRGVNSLMTHFGLSAQEAMDYIVKGTSNGLDKTNELGDNLSEYSGKFAEAGYSASEYFQLLNNGLDGGAYNLDKVNDAINEVTARLADGTIADAIGMYSTKTQELFQAWQDGKVSQKDVIDSIVSDISECTNEQETMNLAAKAFGTMAEDGGTKFIKSMSSVGDTYDSVKGSAEGMFDSSTTESQKLESNMRKLQETLVPLGEMLVELANTILPPLVSGVQKVSEFFGKLPEPVQHFVIILGGLIAAFTALAPVISAVVMVVTTLGTAVLGPIIGIIAGVAAAIAGIIAIVKNWGAITEWFGNLWQVVKDKCVEIWTAICNFFTVTIPQAWDALVAKFQAIPEWWAGLWQQVHDFFAQIWTAIMQNPIIQTIVTTIQSLWQTCVTTLEGIWSGLTTIASGAWELLKNTILAPVLLLIDLVTGNFDKLKSDAQNIWNNIKDAADTIWTGIKELVSSLVSGLVEGVTTYFSGLAETASQIWSGIKQKASEIWNSIKESVCQTASNLKESAVQAFNNLVSGIGSALSGLGQVVSSGFQSAISFITSLPSQAVGWGRDFIMGIVDGIKGAIGWVTDAVSNVASTIRSFLHFSVPDEGPLTDYESWMPDFMQGLAKGIEKSKAVVANAVAGVTKDMTINANALVSQDGTAQSNAITNITAMLAKFLPYLEQGHVLKWDTDEVAGHLAPAMDHKLGELAIEEGQL